MRIIFIVLFITTFITASSFAVNRVLSLDGDSDYVEIEDSEALNSIDSQVTMEAWIKATAFPNEWMPIIYKGDKEPTPSSGRSYTLWLNWNGSLGLGSAPDGKSEAWLPSMSGLIAPNTWYHITTVVDAKGGMMRMFINGIEVANRVFGEHIRSSSLPLRIAWTHEENPGFSPFAGQIDEVRIWNIARTKEELQSTMHTTLSGKEPGLVGYWRFDDEQKIATDSSPSHADGKLIGDAHIVEVELPQIGEPAVLSGMITDETGTPLPNGSIRLEQDGKKIAQTQTDASGNYWIVVFHPAHGTYDLSATHGEKGDWKVGIRLREGESQTLNLTLKEVSSIEGTLLMLDDATPHVAVPVEAVIDEKVIALTLSDENGKYRFINLKPGRYQVCCQILGGYVYYGQKESVTEKADVHVERGVTLKNIDFRFPPFKKGTWKTYTYFDGLPSNSVLAIHCAPDGSMWFGTNGGVSRYDGHQFKNFTTKDGLASDEVFAIYGALDGMLWFGTRNGVSRYDGKEFVNFTAEDGLASNQILSIHSGPDGVLWFGTRGGVSRYDGQEFVNFTQKDGLTSNYVGEIYCDPDGVIWLGTGFYGKPGGGVSRYDGKTLINFTTKDGLAHSWVTAIYHAPDGALWFGTALGGVS